MSATITETDILADKLASAEATIATWRARRNAAAEKRDGIAREQALTREALSAAAASGADTGKHARKAIDLDRDLAAAELEVQALVPHLQAAEQAHNVVARELHLARSLGRLAEERAKLPPADEAIIKAVADLSRAIAERERTAEAFALFLRSLPPEAGHQPQPRPARDVLDEARDRIRRPGDPTPGWETVQVPIPIRI